MPRVDDPNISGDMVLYRRIPNWGDRVAWDDSGCPTAANFNFRDPKDELSVHIAAETTPAIILTGHAGFGVLQLTAGQIRVICRDAKANPVVFICRDDEEPANGHVLVCGKVSQGMAKRLRDAAKWVVG